MAVPAGGKAFSRSCERRTRDATPFYADGAVRESGGEIFGTARAGAGFAATALHFQPRARARAGQRLVLAGGAVDVARLRRTGPQREGGRVCATYWPRALEWTVR